MVYGYSPSYSKGDSGSVSEWNEGDLKNLRLHEAQEMINYGKMNPFSLAEDGVSWKYEIWKGGVDILYGEGQSKYNTEETKEIEKVRALLEKTLRLKKPFRKVTLQAYMGNQTKHMPVEENQQKIYQFLIIYEKQVKKYNDIHGFSTRNKDDFDEGL